MKLTRIQIKALTNKLYVELDKIIDEKNKSINDEYRSSELRHFIDDKVYMLIEEVNFKNLIKQHEKESLIERIRDIMHDRFAPQSTKLSWQSNMQIEEDLIIMSIDNSSFNFDELLEKFKVKYNI